MLSKIIGQNDLNNCINIRFYKIKKGFLNIFLENNDYEGFCVDSIQGKLKFNTGKNEGIVSKCYNNKAVVFVNEDCFSEDYHLTKYQQCLVHDTKFVIASPVFNEHDDVIGIISIDANMVIKISEKSSEELCEYCKVLSRDLYNKFSELF